MLAWGRNARSRSVQLKETLLLSSLQRWSSTRSEHPEYNYEAARDWFKNQYSADTLSKIGEVTYSRSSGPGGQNVNK